MQFDEHDVIEAVIDTSTIDGTLATPVKRVNWIDASGVHDPAVLQKIGSAFSIHPLILEDIMDPNQRPKLDELDNAIFLEFNAFSIDPASGEISIQQVSVYLTKTHVLSFREHGADLFAAVKDRIRQKKGTIRKMGCDYLVYTLLDLVVDNYFNVLEHLEERIDVLEDEIIESPRQDLLTAVQDTKKQLFAIRKSTWPLREILYKLERRDITLVSKGLRIYIRDLYDHVIQVIDWIETYRDIISGMVDIYLSSTSNKMNEVMKTLTVISTIFIPLTFIAGVYGMNFVHMPELASPVAYPFTWIVMGAIAMAFVAFFKRRRWL